MKFSRTLAMNYVRESELLHLQAMRGRVSTEMIVKGEAGHSICPPLPVGVVRPALVGGVLRFARQAFATTANGNKEGAKTAEQHERCEYLEGNLIAAGLIVDQSCNGRCEERPGHFHKAQQARSSTERSTAQGAGNSESAQRRHTRIAETVKTARKDRRRG